MDKKTPKIMGLEIFYSPCKKTSEKNKWNLPRSSIPDPYCESIHFSLN